MSQSTVTTIAGALILAGALLVAFRYDVNRTGSGLPVVLDRWTGQVVLCQPPTKTKDDPFSGLLPANRGIALHCRP